MATKLWKGSSGEDVKTLQTMLNQNGYNLDVDGGFGEKTYAAVVDYQKKHNLAVDGVVGNETWGSLNKTTMPSSPTTGKTVLSGVSDETYDRLRELEQGYTPSDEVLTAQAVRESVEAAKPAAYQSSFDAQLSQLYDEILERKAFSYDPEQDTNYQNYSYLYAQKGRTAMEDTMGKAAGLTGGYASSYAQTAGQQAYNQYLQELAKLMPELEENAYQRYNRQGEQLLQQYELVGDREKEAYKRWQDEGDAWEADYKKVSEAADALQKQDMDAYKLMLQHYTTKANAEQKASDGTRANTGKTSASAKNTSVLSSTAAESLERAMGNYLKSGKQQEADNLLQQYRGRMSTAQKQKIQKLFSQYGVTLSL